jgi:signal transduction histidine kinase
MAVRVAAGKRLSPGERIGMGGALVPLAEPSARQAGLTRSGEAARPPRTRLSWPGRNRDLLTAGVLMASGCVCTLVQGSTWSHATVLAVVNLATSLTFVGTGLLLRQQPGQRRVAWALVLAGILRSLDFSDALGGPGPLYALIFGGMDRLFGAYALLRYPRPALLRHHRVYLIALGAWMIVGRTLIAVTSTAVMNGNPASAWWPALWPDQRLSQAISDVVNLVEGALGVTLAVLLVLRLARTKGLDRLVITPIIVAGLAAVVAATASAVAQMLASISTSPNDAYVVEGIVDLAVPLAFLVAAIQSGLLLKNIAGLTAQFSAGANVDGVRFALRAALRDPTLEVLDLSASGPAQDGDAGEPPGGRAGAGGAEAAAAIARAQPGDRLVELIRTEGGAPIAVVIADPGLARYRGLFDAAVQTSGLALQNAQLQARAARAELGQVRASRARIVEAGLAERRRLERDLHDGAQQHLLALAAQLTAAMTRTRDPAATAAFEQARSQLGEVLAELRNLAHGIHPAVLTHSGLAAALEEVAERLPLPVHVTATPARVAPAVEATAYFVACEALANVVKHAQAGSATVDVRADGSWLEMEISDDGIGGAGTGGQGLANMRDRVGALDGEITVDSPAGRGTRIRVRIPCA